TRGSVPKISSGMAAINAAEAAMSRSTLKAPPPPTSSSSIAPNPFDTSLFHATSPQKTTASSPSFASVDRGPMASMGGIDNTIQGSSSSNNNDSAMMQHLQQQTKIMLQLQQQIQALHVKVDHLERKTSGSVNGNVAAAPSGNSFSFQDNSSPQSLNSDDRSFNMSRTKIYMRPSDSEDEDGTSTAVFTGSTSATARTSNQPPLAQQQQQQQPRRVRFAANIQPAVGPAAPPPPRNEIILVTLFLFPFRALYRYWTYEVQVFRELFRMGRAAIRPLDGGMLFQLFFVSLIVAKSADNPERQQTLGAIVGLGFLWHIKLLQFLWKFFVVDNVPMRIWQGRDPEGNDDDANGNDANGNANANAPRNGVVQPRRPGNNNANAPAAAARGLGNPNINLLMGGIANPHNVDGQGGAQNPISRVLWDITYLFASFLLSIFPMWRPEQRPAAAPVAEETQGEQQERIVPQNALAANNNNNVPAIPLVEPPRDAMEAADDSSSSDGGDADDEESSSDEED
ncbi:MAG: hypothetical protein SGILL_000927, partial [Bacillariaceae sp.]